MPVTPTSPAAPTAAAVLVLDTLFVLEGLVAVLVFVELDAEALVSAASTVVEPALRSSAALMAKGRARVLIFMMLKEVLTKFNQVCVRLTEILG